MKLKTSIVAMLALCLALLAGCASGGVSSSEAPAASADSSAASVSASSADEAQSADVAQAASGAFTPGTYTAVGNGRNGEVVVVATFSEDAITDIQVESEETPTYGGAAVNQLASEVLESQAIDVDMVSGATVSSAAFKVALADCIAQAGGDASSMTGYVPEPIDYVTEADVVIVGAGGAGLSSALAAAEAGASVILLEKQGVVGGNTIMTFNGINAVDSNYQLSESEYADNAPEGGFKELTMEMAPDASEEMVDAYVANSAEFVNKMDDAGLDFELNISEDNRNASLNYWNVTTGGQGKTGETLVAELAREIEGFDSVHLYLNTEATGLITDAAGRVTGVKATIPDGAMEFTGSAVILATGSFSANLDMVLEYRPDLEGLLMGVTAPTTGDGIVWAEELGAQTLNMDTMNLFPNIIKDYGMGIGVAPGEQGAFDGIYVNEKGERFMQEGGMMPDVEKTSANEANFCIFDDSGLNDRVETLVKAGYVSEADSLEELAGKLGIDPDGLVATVAAYNEDIADGTDDAFEREGGLNDLSGEKFYGWQFGRGSHYVLGGLATNAQAQVLKEDGSAIPGLYAAGEITGSFQGSFRLDGSGIGESMIFGMIAGREAAAEAQ